MFSAIELFSGLVAGVATTLVVHPLDLIKTRLQLDTSRRYFGASLALGRKVYNLEGGVAGLYRGLGPNLAGNAASWALYFYCYAAIKNAIYQARGADGTNLKASDFLLASATAGVATTVATNPIWVIKTRMLSTSSQHEHAYRSTLSGVRSVLRNEGWQGLYRGLLPSMIGVSHGAVQFMIYEKFKQHRFMANTDATTDPSNWELLVYSGLSKAMAGTATYPYQVVRSRLQTYDANKVYRDLPDMLSKIWRREGIFGFYKGLATNLIRIVPSGCITFLAYENTKVILTAANG